MIPDSNRFWIGRRTKRAIAKTLGISRTAARRFFAEPPPPGA